MIFNSLEKALYLLDAFKLCASRGWGAVSNSQAVRGPGEPVRQARELSLDPEGGIAPGTKWEDIPEDFQCPLCMVDKDQFSEG